MNLKESYVNRIIRLSIPFMVAVIVGIYYLSERKPFPYEHYEEYINQLRLNSAELNENIALVRFGALEYYDPIIQAQAATDKALLTIQDSLKKTPNPKIKAKFDALKDTIDIRRDLTEKFKRINPILLNATISFSTLLGKIVESESNALLVETCSQVQFKSEKINKANDLLRGILIYVSQKAQKKSSDLALLVKDLRGWVPEADPELKERLDLALNYAEKILELQPQMDTIDETIFQVPTVEKLNELDDAYIQENAAFRKLGNQFRIILYVLVFTLLLVLRWLFTRLQNTVVSLNIEVDQKIKAQNELAETNRQLEQRVTERTYELTVKNKDLNQALGDLKDAQEQLIMQEKMASVGMLSAGIAHEIKNPLNFVNNFSDISVELVKELDEELQANEDKLPKDTVNIIQEILADLKTNCHKIKEHGVRADNIVKNMLAHSQEASVQKEWIDLKNLMDDNIQIALESFKATTEKFDVTIEKQYDLKLEKIMAAPQGIGRVFIYLIDNALDALNEKKATEGPDYRPTLTITLQQFPETVMINIRDNGNGIPKKFLDKVFEPFFTTKPTGKGNTGLGLSICYDTVVKQHKGELKVASAEGIYTEFTIVLPVDSKKS